jgi:hypothetical protein
MNDEVSNKQPLAKTKSADVPQLLNPCNLFLHIIGSVFFS